MKKLTCSVFLLASIATLVFLSTAAADTSGKMSFLTPQHTFIVDEAGKPVVLKGCNLGNWLLLELWMMQFNNPGISDQHDVESVLTKRFGAAECDRLMDIFYGSWITDRDFKIICSFGMNCVRLPVYYGLLEDDNDPFNIRPDGWHWLDKSIDMCQRNGVYCIISMHGAPGGQSDRDHTGWSRRNQLWDSDLNKARTAFLWRAIAERYRGRAAVAGYDAINEPWGGSREQQAAIFDLIYRAIRSVDKRHIVFAQGNWDGIDHLGRPRDKGWTNVAMSQHFYPGVFGDSKPTVETHARFFESLKDWDAKLKSLDCPFLIGEFNVVYNAAGGATMMRRHYDAYSRYGWAATMWSYKVLRGDNDDGATIWWMVTNKEQPLRKIDLNMASIGDIESYFKSFATMPYLINEPMRKAMVSTEKLPLLPSPSPLPAPIKVSPANDPLPGWAAVDIGGAMAGGQKVTPDGIDLYGAGNDIYNKADQFRYLCREVEGDFEISVTAESLAAVHTFAKSGLMIRQNLEPDSAHVMINVRPDGSLEFGWRPQPSAYMATEGRQGADLPGIRLKLVRKGKLIEGYYALPKADWHKFKDIEVPTLEGKVYVGLFCMSHDNSRLIKAGFKDLSFKQLP